MCGNSSITILLDMIIRRVAAWRLVESNERQYTCMHYRPGSHTYQLSLLAKPSYTDPSIRSRTTANCKSLAVVTLTRILICVGSTTVSTGTGLAAIHSGHRGTHAEEIP